MDLTLIRTGLFCIFSLRQRPILRSSRSVCQEKHMLRLRGRGFMLRRRGVPDGENCISAILLPISAILTPISAILPRFSAILL